MPLTRDLKETIQVRIERDPVIRERLMKGKHPTSTAGRGADPAGPAGSKTEREVRAVLCGQGPVPGGFPVPGQRAARLAAVLAGESPAGAILSLAP